MFVKSFFFALALGVLSCAAGAADDWPEPYPLAATLAPEPVPSVVPTRGGMLCDAPPPQHQAIRRQRWRQECRDALADPGIQAD